MEDYDDDRPELEDTCGTCSRREDARCTLRDEALDARTLEHGWCLDHPDLLAPSTRRARGPVLLSTASGTRVVSPAKDRSGERDDLIDLLAESDAVHSGALNVPERVALWQLEQWRERRALVHTERFDGPATLPEFRMPGARIEQPDDAAAPPPPLPPLPSDPRKSVRRKGVFTRFVPTADKGRWAIWALSACLVASAAFGYVQWEQQAVIEAYQNGASNAATLDEEAQGRLAIVSFVYVASLITSAVFFIRWFARAYRNVPAFDGGRTLHTPGWAIGSWFVPILNLFRPVQIMSELWRRSAPHAEKRGTPLIPLWWTAWLAEGVLENVSSRLMDSFENFELGITLGIVATTVRILAGLLLIQLIRGVVARQGDGPSSETVAEVFA